jgi:hypothetical protein
MRSLSVLSLTLSLLTLLPAAGCFNPDLGDGGFGCKPADGDKACPSGFVCLPEGSGFVCRRPSKTDAAVDVKVADAAVDTAVDSAPPDVLAPDVLAPDVFSPDLCDPIDLPDDTFKDSNCDGVDGDAADSIFVDPINGSDTSGDGTKAKPLQHLMGPAGAIALAKAQSKSHILVSTGALSESVTVEVPDGISVWGGYDASQGWQRSNAIARPRVTVTAPTAVRVSSPTSPMRWDRLDVTAGDAVAAGESSYGFVVVSGSALTLTNTIVTAGKGALGTAATTPSKQATPAVANGSVGGGERVATCCVAQISNSCAPGAAGKNSCAFSGGAGNPCGAPAAPVPGKGPKPGKGGGPNSPGGAGGPGDPGTPAPVPTVAFGTVGTNGYTPAQGTTGGDGTAGSGGGGGGFNGPNGCTCNTLVTTKPGHGGGAGGCGGKPATAAGGGGGSFALFLFDASPTLDNVKLVAGKGGDGGKGVVGGPGMDGGLGGGTNNVRGGDGGSGGPGAPSSGGPGGPSICLEQVGTSAPIYTTTPTFVVGSPGLGGSSPNAALKGVIGIVANERTN